MSSDEDGAYQSDVISDDDQAGFPEARDQDATGVEFFGWDDDRKISGRRKKAQQAAKKKAKPGSFETMGLSELVLKAIRRKGYRLPTPIQRKSMPLILQGLDVVGMARTGSGKTAAFTIPMVEKLKTHSSIGVRAVLLAPARELALQTYKVAKELARHTNLTVAALVGGDSMEAQFAELAAGPDVIVATPGRLLHHLQEVDGFTLKSVEFLVFDEADRLFEMGFAEQVKAIINQTSPSRQTLLFSATMPRMLAEFAQAGLRHPELVRLDTETKVSPDLAMAFFTVRQDDKPAALLFLLNEVVSATQPTIVFVSTRHHVEFLTTLIQKEGHKVAAVHGTMDQSARKINLAKFRAGKASILVVTDVAARGLDIPLLDNVINYDFPPKPKLFVHRAGRAARAGRLGTAYSFVCREELAYLIDLHLFLSRPLAPAPIRSLKEAAADTHNHSLAPSLTGGNTQPQTTSTQQRQQEGIYGAFPQAALDTSIERVGEILQLSPELAMAQGSCLNAYKLYVKTRPPAAPESARRAKELAKEGVHPLLAAALPSDALGGLEAQTELADFTAKLRSYRPSQTVFEAQVAPARAGTGSGLAATPGVLAAGAHESKVEVMRMKREAHAKVIAATKQRELLEGNANGTGSVLLGADGSDVLAGMSYNKNKAKNKDTHADEFDDVEEEEEIENEEEEEEENDTADDDEHAVLPSTSKKRKLNNSKAAAAVGVLGSSSGTRFREDGFYISHLPGENTSDEKFLAVADGLNDAVMDMTAEDADGVRLQKSSTYHWDKKSKRYIKLQPGEKVMAGKRVKTESGVKVLLKKGAAHKKDGGGGGETGGGGAYEKWAKKNKMRVGKGNGAKAGALTSQMGDRFKKGGRGWSNPFKADGVDGQRGGGGKQGIKDDLLNPDQVRKQRREEEKKKTHLQKRKQESQQRDSYSQGGGKRGRGGGFKKGGSARGGSFSSGGPKRGGGGGGGASKFSRGGSRQSSSSRGGRGRGRARR